jgi:hypothetical protein
MTTQLDTVPPEFDQGSHEERTRTVDFAKALAVGRTLQSASATLRETASGDDHSAVGIGAVQVAAPTVVSVAVRALERGHDYELVVVAVASGSPTEILESHTLIRCPE